MSTTSNTQWNNNLSLGLLNTPNSSELDPETRDAIDSHMAVTGGLQQIVSDTNTFRAKANVDMFAGAIVGITAGASEAGLALANNESSIHPYVLALGFILVDAAAGDYVTVYRRGLNPFCSGMSPGLYQTFGPQGTVIVASTQPTLGSSHQSIGFALTPTDLIFDLHPYNISA